MRSDHIRVRLPARSCSGRCAMGLSSTASRLPLALLLLFAGLIPQPAAAARFSNAGDGTASCHRYRGTMNGGPVLGTAGRQTNSSADCERACRTTAGCYVFVYTPCQPAVDAAPGPLTPGRASYSHQPRCTVFNQSNIGNGRNMPGTPTSEDLQACCALCSSNPLCESWTWACDSWPCPAGESQPCWLHSYGAHPAVPTHSPTWVSGLQTAHPRPKLHGGSCELHAQLPQNTGHSDQWSGPGVNSGTGSTSGLCGVDDSQFDNPLELLNSTDDASGVPLGGIGVGFIDYAPDGQIKRVAINNAHEDGVLTDIHDGTFLALWEEGKGTARVLQRTPVGGAAQAAGLADLSYSATNFTGLFPTAALDVDDGAVKISAWSALVPQQIENSSLPLVYFDVTVRNSKSTTAAISVAFSWQDVISRNIFDASPEQLDACYPNNTGPATCALDVNRLMQCIGGWGVESCELNGRTRCRDMARVPTSAAPLSVGGSLTGVEQRATAGKLSPNKLTMQQYNDRVAVLVEKQDGDEVSLMTSFNPSLNGSSSKGVEAWKAWAGSGRFPSSTDNALDSEPLYRPVGPSIMDVVCDGALRDACAGEKAAGGPQACMACLQTNEAALTHAGCSVAEAEAYCNAPSGDEAASAVALRTSLKAGEVRTIRFVVAWHAQEVSNAGRTDNRTVCGTTDHNRMYHNRFAGGNGLESLVSYATDPAVRAALRTGTVEWHTPVLASTMPGFLQFKLINSGYTMYTNALLNKAGHFSAMEGGMGGLAGTQDQRIAAHLFYFKFFTATDTLELRQFGAAQVTTCQDIQHWPHGTCSQFNSKHGAITHFDANIYASITGFTNDSVVTANGEYEDNTYGWLYQLAKSYAITGNLSAVMQQKHTIPKAIAHANSLITSAQYMIPGPASNTYDDFWELPLDTYVASMYPMVMTSSALLARAIGDTKLAEDCEARANAGGRDFVKALYNGKFFAYGSQVNGSGRADEIMFSGMLAGQMLSRHAGFGDLPGVPWHTVVSSMEQQLATHVAHSYNFYPPKVYNLSTMSAALDPGNHNEASTWPFYLESYTAAAAIQAGFLEDGLDVIRHIGLLNLRLGLGWAQNLWNPGFLTYVTAPVTWFVPDVLAAAELDVGSKTLFLAPTMRTTETRVVLPLFFPQFWATVEATRASAGPDAPAVTAAGGTITLKIVKSYGDAVSIKQVTAQPIGVGSANATTLTLAAPFRCEAGATLDLSAHWNALMDSSVIRDRVLPPNPPTSIHGV